MGQTCGGTVLWNPSISRAFFPAWSNRDQGKGQLMIRKLVLAFGLSAMTLTAAACNTVRGAGEDLESAANEVDEEI